MGNLLLLIRMLVTMISNDDEMSDEMIKVEPATMISNHDYDEDKHEMNHEMTLRITLMMTKP